VIHEYEDERANHRYNFAFNIDRSMTSICTSPQYFELISPPSSNNRRTRRGRWPGRAGR